MVLVVLVVVMVRLQVLHLARVGRRPRARARVVASDYVHADDTTVQVGRHCAAGRQVRSSRHALVGAPSRRDDDVSDAPVKISCLPLVLRVVFVLVRRDVSAEVLTALTFTHLLLYVLLYGMRTDRSCYTLGVCTRTNVGPLTLMCYACPYAPDKP